MKYNLKQKVLDVTNGGLDIICYYYPAAREVIDGQSKHFKMRAEKTASASIRQNNSTWYVTDFGGDQIARNAFDIAMEEENLSFTEVLHLLAERYNVGYRLDPAINKPQKFNSRTATTEEIDGELRYIKKVKMSAADNEVMGAMVTDEVLAKYGFSLLESYSWTKNRTTYEITSSDDYPIMLLELEYKDDDKIKSFKKIVKPLEPDGSRRFYYSGEKPRNYVFGLDQVRSTYSKFIADSEEDEESPKKRRKLDCVIIASGERDALNVAAMGYPVIWFNGETSKELDSIIWELYKMCDRVYNIPDIDSTGVRVGTEKALKHFDMYTVWLPTSITKYKDKRGKPRKDLRDYLELHPSKVEFANLLDISQCAKFWEISYSDNGKSREVISTAYLLYYLRLNGFYKMEDKDAKDITHLIRIDHYKVQLLTAKKIRDFVREDLIARKVSNSVLNLFLNSKRTNTTISDDLSTINISFDSHTATTRQFYFANCALNITANVVDTIKLKDLNRVAASYCWIDKISPINFKRTEKSFSVQRKDDNNWDIDFHNLQSNYFKFLINTSRIYWREEYEYRTDDNALSDKVYKKDYKFSLKGSRLSAEEINEQLQHMVNKIYVIGFLLHRHKFEDKGQAVWVMENKITNENESNGGSGKSLMIYMLKKLHLLKIDTLNGRSKKLTTNDFALDRISTKTDVLYVDDAAKKFDFDYFFPLITNSTNINPKGTKSYEIDFANSPNLVFTSNYPPPDKDGSHSRRILYTVFSDYYHARANNSGTTNYLSKHKPSYDLGIVLAGDDYTDSMYNDDINFCIDCLQFYLQMLAEGVEPIMPPMDQVRKRLNLVEMGQMFAEWAELYFSEDSENLDRLLKRKDLFDDFKSYTGLDVVMSATAFRVKLLALIQNSDHLVALNPKNHPDCNYNSKGRMISKESGGIYEYFYIQSIIGAERFGRGEPITPP